MKQASGLSTQSAEWIGRHEIEDIEGALKPSAYVARAYKYTMEYGHSPIWARKVGGGHWLFERTYIQADAERNRVSMSVHEAAEVLGATRRAIQVWVDAGDIPLLAGEREKGEERRILREPFLRDVEQFRRRLETASVVGRKIRSGHEVPLEVLDRLEEDRQHRALDARVRNRTRLRAWRENLRTAAMGRITVDHREEILAPPDAAFQPAPPPVAASAKEKAALSIETRLKAAMAAHREHPSAIPIAVDKHRAALTLEQKLTRAAATVQQKAGDPVRLEERATGIAQRILDRMFDEGFSRIKAMILFSQAAEEQGVPPSVKVKVSRKVFGAGA